MVKVRFIFRVRVVYRVTSKLRLGLGLGLWFSSRLK